LSSKDDAEDPTLEFLGVTNHCVIHLLISDKDHKEDDEDAFIMRQISKLEAQERQAKSSEPEVGFRGTALFS
jgi:hypothetical protein